MKKPDLTSYEVEHLRAGCTCTHACWIAPRRIADYWLWQRYRAAAQQAREEKLSRRALSRRIQEENRVLWRKSFSSKLYGVLKRHSLQLQTERETWIILTPRYPWNHPDCQLAVRVADYWKFLLSPQYEVWLANFRY